ncbi:hypothetical protein J2847_006531 [Azospirillum agricola]|uniref:DUF3305 domain-containing protein n=1 Tax=Azospirillum agricola TaxID=1720247 RepID=UPI001AEB7398|nr:DUF3305 domain-containing protein [Azospirillum agricola]MBP2233196.1 hypothetical protein [Azospirillum agricola]
MPRTTPPPDPNLSGSALPGGSPDRGQRRNVGVVVERRRVDNPWVEASWQPTALIPPSPDRTDWSLIDEGPGWARYYAGAAEIALFPSEAENYKHNLDSGRPTAYVILRPGGGPLGVRLLAVTVDPGEIDTHSEAGDDLIEPLPLPSALALWMDGFVARHFVDRPFHKRKRDRADTEALARRKPERGDG